MQFIDKSVNKKAINEFFNLMKNLQNEIHTIQIYKNNKCILRIAQDPYSCSEPREVYSLSKTFTSTVIGIASDMGLLSTQDRVIDFFPEINTKSSYFQTMSVRNLLSMNTGHGECVMPLMCRNENSVKGFFSKEPEYMPGTHFTYNSGATCLLGSIISRVTGVDFFDFACEKLFYPLGIYNISWSRCHDGSCQCATGLHISNDDIAKLGLLYLNKGIYNGKRILSEKWITEATSSVSDNSDNGPIDWSSGYGYQIWINSRDGYRGDGACGQLCLVLPKHNTVAVVQAMNGSIMQTEVDGIFELLENLEGPADCDEEYSFSPLPQTKDVPLIDKVFRLDKNLAGLKTLHISSNKDLLKLSFSDGAGIQTIFAGNGKWEISQYTAKYMTPMLGRIMTAEYSENIKTAGCFKLEDGKIKILLRYLTNPHSEVFEIGISENEIKLNILSSHRAENLNQITGTCCYK